jgi:hypothetical protein
MVPLLSIFPQLEPLLLYTVWAIAPDAIRRLAASIKTRNIFMVI